MAERFAMILLTESGSILLIPEQLILNHIPISEIKAGIKRGKEFKRFEWVQQLEEPLKNQISESRSNECSKD